MRVLTALCFLLLSMLYASPAVAQNIIRYSFAPGPGKTTDPGAIMYYDQLDAMRRQARNRGPAPVSYNTNFKFTYTTKKQREREEQEARERKGRQLTAELEKKDQIARTVKIGGVETLLDVYPLRFGGSVLIVQRHGKYGLLDVSTTEGTLIQPIAYDHIDRRYGVPFAICEQAGKLGVLDTNGKTVFPPQFDAIERFNGDLLVVQKGERLGIVNSKGETVLPLRFHEIQALNKGTSIVFDGARFGIVDAQGKLTVGTNCLLIERVKDNLFIVAEKGKWLLYDYDRKEILHQYAYDMMFHNDFNKVIQFWEKASRRTGLLNYEGELVLMAGDYYRAGYPYGYAMKIGRKWGFVDFGFEGRFLLTVRPHYDSISEYDPAKGTVTVWENGAPKQRSLSILGFTKIRDFENGLAAATQGAGWGFIDYSGKVVIPLRYEDVGSFNGPSPFLKIENTTAPARQRGKWGLINREGNWVVPAQYDEVRFLYNGATAVRNGSDWSIVNNSNEVMTKQTYKEIGIAVPLRSSIIVIPIRGANGKWGLINTIGTELLPPKYDEIVVIDPYAKNARDRKIQFRKKTRLYEFIPYAKKLKEHPLVDE